VAVNGAGSVFVADAGNHALRKITPDGVVTTLAGTAGSSGSFDDLRGVAVDGTGNVFIAESSHVVRKITPAGVVSTLAGSSRWSGAEDGTGASARFNTPQGLAVDGAGNVFVADWGNNTIRKITPDGTVATFAGTAGSQGGTDGTGAVARFHGPSCVAVDGAGNLFIADTLNGALRKITPDGVVTTLAGTANSRGGADGTGAAARFQEPDSVGIFPGPLPASLVSPYGVAVDPSSGSLYIAVNDAIMVALFSD
jgi:sugar lactone lactonase YvrE